jgi:hypothetical protein
VTCCWLRLGITEKEGTSVAGSRYKATAVMTETGNTILYEIIIPIPVYSQTLSRDNIYFLPSLRTWDSAVGKAGRPGIRVRFTAMASELFPL